MKIEAYRNGWSQAITIIMLHGVHLKALKNKKEVKGLLRSLLFGCLDFLRSGSGMDDHGRVQLNTIQCQQHSYQRLEKSSKSKRCCFRSSVQRKPCLSLEFYFGRSLRQFDTLEIKIS